MAKKTSAELEAVEGFVQRSFIRGVTSGQQLREVLDKPYKLGEPFGYSMKLEDKSVPGFPTIYNVVVAKLPDKYAETARRIKLHEYGHVYLGHFDGVYEDLDRRIMDVFTNQRADIVKDINEQCNIDFGEELVDRVLDDPYLSHELHNIAMDMEVNSKILSTEDVEAMESDITEFIETLIPPKPEKKKKDEDTEDSDDVDKAAKDAVNDSKIKFILPERYHFKDNTPFPDGLSYPEYMILVVRNLSQFVKMAISISLGGSGDTSDVSDEDLQNALSGGMGGLNDLLDSLGLGGSEGQDAGDSGDESNQIGSSTGKDKDKTAQKDPTKGSSDGSEEGKDQQQSGDESRGAGANAGGLEGKGSERIRPKYRGCRNRQGNGVADHSSPDSEKRTEDRRLGRVDNPGGFGCGTGGAFSGMRDVKITRDEIDEAIEEVIRRTKSRVIKRVIKRDVIRNYNLGKNRTVIAPSIIARNRIDKKPRLVFILDISGSMDTELVDRVLNTIARKMRQINRGLMYDILTWSHEFGDWWKDIVPGKPVPKIHTGGGTQMADSLRFFKEHYDPSATFILISDFEDYLEEWCKVLKDMQGYSGWGFNYGRQSYEDMETWPGNFEVRDFNKSYKSKSSW